MKVAILCEYSGIVRNAFIEAGHDAISCDILSTELFGPHIQDDLFNHDWSGYDLIIAHPPCTYLCNSGVSWLYRQKGRWDLMKHGAEFFKKILDFPNKKIAIENPIMHKYAVEIIGRRQDQIVQPWMFGHGETKATGFWLKGLPKLKPTKIVDGREQRIHRLPPSPERSKLRSKTFLGIAEAMAEQWT